jgi:hypothetical protein
MFYYATNTRLNTNLEVKIFLYNIICQKRKNFLKNKTKSNTVVYFKVVKVNLEETLSGSLIKNHRKNEVPLTESFQHD